MAGKKIGIAFRKYQHENIFQLLRLEFANYELMEIDVDTGDRGTCSISFVQVVRFIYMLL